MSTTLCSFYTFLILVLLIIPVKSVRIPFINNTILEPVYNMNSILLTNLSCQQCLCYSNLSYPALNYFSNNNSCQLFPIFPRTYHLKETIGARLYFTQQTLPNISESCMPNINDLLNKLRLVNLTSVNISNPSELIIDNHDYIATIDHTLNAFVRFNRTNLNRIDSIPVQTSSQMAIAYRSGVYYIKSYTNPMIVMNSTSLIVLNNISLTPVNRARSILFLNNGQTMIVTSYGTNSLVFFNRSNDSPINYRYMSSQLVNYSGPYGMWHVNDSFFYVTSYDNSSLYSYTSHINGSWEETWLFNIANLGVPGGVTHVTVDDNNRLWISLEADTTLIYDQQGNLLGNYTIPNSKIDDIKILDNYVIYFSDSNLDRIIRLDPNIQCN